MLLRSRRFFLLVTVILASFTFLSYRYDALSVAARARWTGFTSGKGKGWEGVKHVFVFGDSYSSTSFNHADDAPRPSLAGNPLGNPPWPGRTWAGGPNWVSYLTTHFNRTQILTYNFASGGATLADDLISSTHPLQISSLSTQIMHSFLPLIGTWTPTPRTADNTLYILWIGINDVLRTPGEILEHHPPASSSPKDPWQEMVGLVQQAADRLVELLDVMKARAGARRFLVLGVPPVEKSPAIMGQNKVARDTVMALLKVWNNMVERKVDEWGKRTKGEGTEVTWYATGRLFHEIVEHPKRWGFKNSLRACDKYFSLDVNTTANELECGAPLDEFVWKDQLHPTSKLHYWLAKDLAGVIADTRKD